MGAPMTPEMAQQRITWAMKEWAAKPRGLPQWGELWNGDRQPMPMDPVDIGSLRLMSREDLDGLVGLPGDVSRMMDVMVRDTGDVRLWGKLYGALPIGVDLTELWWCYADLTMKAWMDGPEFMATTWPANFDKRQEKHTKIMEKFRQLHRAWRQRVRHEPTRPPHPLDRNPDRIRITQQDTDGTSTGRIAYALIVERAFTPALRLFEPDTGIHVARLLQAAKGLK